jgi:hypothetical protein
VEKEVNMARKKLTARELKALARAKKAQESRTEEQKKLDLKREEEEKKRLLIGAFAQTPRLRKKLMSYAKKHTAANLEFALMLVNDRNIPFSKAVVLATKRVGK